MTEFEKKVGLVRELITELQIDGLLFTQQKNVSWLASGRSYVNQASETAIAFILITRETKVLIVNNIEKDRLLEEEIQGEFDQIMVFSWFEPSMREKIISDYSSQNRIELDSMREKELCLLRTMLSEEEKERMRVLGLEGAQAIEKTIVELQQGESEFEIAGRMAANCWSRGIEPIVTLVAVDQRVYLRRHPLPTHLPLRHYAMLVLCGRRQGQVVSVTRLVHFGQPSEELLKLHQAVAYIDAQMIAQTIPGVSYSELFERTKEVYRLTGFENEWMQHHQGGLSGYNTREVLLLPDSKQKVQPNQAYAWNPSIAGVKSEDTIMTTGSSQEIITHTGEFQYLQFECNGSKILRPSIYIRS